MTATDDMNGDRSPAENATPAEAAPPSKGRAALVFAEFAMIIGLLLVWVFSDDVKQSTSLVVLFLYSFPSEFLIGLVPHEPVLLYYGMHHPPLTVALVAVASTVLAEGINYSVFGFITATPIFERMSRKKSVQRIVALFAKAPFTAILVAGFTPVPFFPVRFLVVMGRYPVLKYMLGVFISRAPRFYILAQAGSIFDIPGWALAAIFAFMILTVNVPLVRRLLGRERG